MHACGHDNHIIIMLGVIEICLKNFALIEKSSYDLRFIFQPAEEICKGALQMIQCGALENINEIYGIHNSSIMLKKIGTKEGVMIGRTSKFLLQIKNPNRGNETLLCACNISHL